MSLARSPMQEVTNGGMDQQQGPGLALGTWHSSSADEAASLTLNAFVLPGALCEDYQTFAEKHQLSWAERDSTAPHGLSGSGWQPLAPLPSLSLGCSSLLTEFILLYNHPSGACATPERHYGGLTFRPFALLGVFVKHLAACFE